MSQEDLNHFDSKDDLPPDLKAVEAELSALHPRDDRLDRERLVFLAGRASLAREVSWRTRVWPAAFAGMTMVAATLLAVLLIQYEPRANARVAGGARPDETRTANVGLEVAQKSSSLPGRPTDTDSMDTIREPEQSLVRPEWNSVRSRAMYFEMCSWMLSQGVDPWVRPLAVLAVDDDLSPDPLSYGRWRRDLLEAEPQSDRPERWRAISPGSGVDL